MGLRSGDTSGDADVIVQKVLTSRLFADSETDAAWKKSVVDISGEILCVSQFTLYGRVKRAKPDFSRAMRPGEVCHPALMHTIQICHAGTPPAGRAAPMPCL